MCQYLSSLTNVSLSVFSQDKKFGYLTTSTIFWYFDKWTFAQNPITHQILLLSSFTPAHAYCPIHLLSAVKINSLLFLFLEISKQQYFTTVNYQSIEQFLGCTEISFHKLHCLCFSQAAMKSIIFFLFHVHPTNQTRKLLHKHSYFNMHMDEFFPQNTYGSLWIVQQTHVEIILLSFLNFLFTFHLLRISVMVDVITHFIPKIFKNRLLITIVKNRCSLSYTLQLQQLTQCNSTSEV